MCSARRCARSASRSGRASTALSASSWSPAGSAGCWCAQGWGPDGLAYAAGVGMLVCASLQFGRFAFGRSGDRAEAQGERAAAARHVHLGAVEGDAAARPAARGPAARSTRRRRPGPARPSVRRGSAARAGPRRSGWRSRRARSAARCRSPAGAARPAPMMVERVRRSAPGCRCAGRDRAGRRPGCATTAPIISSRGDERRRSSRAWRGCGAAGSRSPRS